MSPRKAAQAAGERYYQGLPCKKLEHSGRRYSKSSACVECCLDSAKAKRDAAPGQARSYNLQYAYGITVEDYDVMLERQGGACRICGKLPEDNRHGKLFVDHCHETRAVRGLLCSSCNLVLGYAKDDVTTLQSAINYLNSFKE